MFRFTVISLLLVAQLIWGMPTQVYGGDVFSEKKTEKETKDLDAETEKEISISSAQTSLTAVSKNSNLHIPNPNAFYKSQTSISIALPEVFIHTSPPHILFSSLRV